MNMLKLFYLCLIVYFTVCTQLLRYIIHVPMVQGFTINRDRMEGWLEVKRKVGCCGVQNDKKASVETELRSGALSSVRQRLVSDTV